VSRETGLLTYAVVTPARDEADNIRRLAASLGDQMVVPACWVVVDDGSQDETAAILEDLKRDAPWIRGVAGRPSADVQRGGPVVRAFHVGLESLTDVAADVVVKVDADVSFEPDYFVRLLQAFADDDRLGIASGAAWEYEHGRWVPRHMTGDSVWGAARAYRRECLRAVLPLEERMGWDGIDAYKAALAGWSTKTIEDLQFRHHRKEGERDGARRTAWAAQGSASYFMGYRFTYLAARAVHRSVEEPAALAMVPAYLKAWLKREPRCDDAAVRALIRREQSLFRLPGRVADVRRARSGRAGAGSVSSGQSQ
jgi:biofilm PGA synthesis N-glycosyltransferase PgaC